MALTVVISVVNITRGVMRADYHDTLFEYTIDSDYYEITDLYTGGRQKDDYSSAYVYNDASTSAISYIRVMGSFGSNEPYDNCTYGNSLSCPVGSSRYLPNTVREDGYTYAGLLFDPGNGHHGYIHIWWSPDSI